MNLKYKNEIFGEEEYGERIGLKTSINFNKNKNRQKLKLGISISHNESMNPEKLNHFILFFEFLNNADINFEIIDTQLENYNELKKYPVILIGAPETKFTINELNNLREFVEFGGNLLIIQKYGGDRTLNTNLTDLFDHIIVNDDMLTNSLYNHNRFYQPIIQLIEKNNFFNFKGKICYDGGCTYNVKKDVKFSLYPENGSFSNLNPHWVYNNYKFNDQKKPGAILVYDQIGKGSVLFWGARWSFSNKIINHYDNRILLKKILSLMFKNIYSINLIKRMRNPQRHRLLHGYPMSSGLNKISDSRRNFLNELDLDNSKPIAVGIIPHTFCNPAIMGCGFCTFPHEQFNRSSEITCVESVISELGEISKKYPNIINRKVSSIYIGGGTANLMSDSSFENLCESIIEHLKINEKTEITFEGAPVYFSERADLIQKFRNFFPTANLRLSMGVQTFDKKLLSLMGRHILNRENSVETVIEIADKYNINVSVDLLYNLPDQTYSQMENDVKKSVKLGISHICLYNLVCYEGLGSEWSKDPIIMKKMPSKLKAVENWCKLHELMKDLGYNQVTLTDFQKLGSGYKGRYIYEEDLRYPNKTDWLGIGPSAISIFTDRNSKKSIKVMNPENSFKYINNKLNFKIPWEKQFNYSLNDLKIYWLTRQIKSTKISKSEYEKLFNNTIEQDFYEEFSSFKELELMSDNEDNYELTVVGMYYADSIAGLLAWFRVNEINLNNLDSEVTSKKDWNDSRATWMA